MLDITCTARYTVSHLQMPKYLYFQVSSINTQYRIQIVTLWKYNTSEILKPQNGKW